jgi:hypothetical protein
MIYHTSEYGYVGIKEQKKKLTDYYEVLLNWLGAIKKLDMIRYIGLCTDE